MGVGGQRHAPAALSRGKTRYPLRRRLGGPQGRSGRVWRILPPPGFDPQTVQSVAIRYTDHAIAALNFISAVAKWHMYILMIKELCRTLHIAYRMQ